jgi:uncharacterized protein YjbI with pentapeptide repeats
MPNKKHLEILLKGPEIWNSWRKQNPRVKPDLSETDLNESDLRDMDLTEADLSGANLVRANLWGADLSGANLAGATLYEANLTEADLSEAFLRWADLSRANLTGANLNDADLRRTHLTRTVFKGANLSGCKVYGISAWNLQLDDAVQSDLVITDQDELVITVDDIETAQFVYLILNNKKIRNVINTVTSKAVLILGRFTPERKAYLDALREEIRKKDLLPILFDFDRPTTRNLTETISTLAHLARFVIADITDARSIPQELQRIVPGLPSLPVQPLILSSDYQYGMFRDFLDFTWVLPLYRYENLDTLLESLEEKVIAPAEAKATEIQRRRAALEEEMNKGL